MLNPNPTPRLEATFHHIAATRMAGLPICNPALSVEAVGFRQGPAGHWVGALVTPWGINLLCLPDGESPWPVAGADGKCGWRFASGDYEFTRAVEPSLGEFHLCSLFSPALEFTDQAAARLVALAAVMALFRGPVDAPPAAGSAAVPPPSRRRFLGLGS